MKELAALNRVSAREKLAAKRRAKQQAKLSAKQKEKNTETLVGNRVMYLQDSGAKKVNFNTWACSVMFAL